MSEINYYYYYYYYIIIVYCILGCPTKIKFLKLQGLAP